MGKPKPAGVQSTTFFPPLAIQQSVWDSILNGNFIDAKIFAFSRRSRKSGRVDTPKVLFVNIHVLASACTYFQSTFSFSEGIETRRDGELPPGVESFFDLEDCDLDSDFDCPVEDDPVEPQAQVSPDVSECPQKPVKAYLVKYTAYRTLRAIVWYIYSGDITFSSGSPGELSASAKSVYRFADEHKMDHLKTLASEAISSSIDRLSSCELVEEACSVSCNIFISRYPEWRCIYVELLASVLSSDLDAKTAFQTKLSAYFCGELPHCKEIITSTLLCLLDESTIRDSDIGENLAVEHNAVLRVPRPWPNRTKEALRRSLDSGIFDGFELEIVNGREKSVRLVYLAPAVMDDGIHSPLWRWNALCELDFSPSTWQALAYYTYTGYVAFKPLGSQTTGPVAGVGPSDPWFRGDPCSMKEMFGLACKLGYQELTDVVTAEMLSSLEPENVVEGTFSDSQLPPEVVERGVEIICSFENRSDPRIHSDLREILEEAATGSRLGNLDAFSVLLSNL